MASIYGQILNAVASQLSAIPSIPLNNAGQPNVSVRSKPLDLSGVDVLPNVIVWPGPGAEQQIDLQFGGPTGTSAGVWWEYPVSVVLIVAGNRGVQSGLTSFLNLREAIRNQLFIGSLTGFPSNVFDVEIELGDVFDLQAFLSGNYDVCSFVCRYKSTEQLSG